MPRRTAKTRQENEGTANHPWTASPKGRLRLLVCYQKAERKGSDVVRRSLCSRNYKTGAMCRQEGRSTNTDCQNAQHIINSAVLQTEVQKGTRQLKESTNKGQHSRKNKRKMVREADAWTITTYVRRSSSKVS